MMVRFYYETGVMKACPVKSPAESGTFAPFPEGEVLVFDTGPSRVSAELRYMFPPTSSSLLTLSPPPVHHKPTKIVCFSHKHRSHPPCGKGANRILLPHGLETDRCGDSYHEITTICQNPLSGHWAATRAICHRKLLVAPSMFALTREKLVENH